MFDFSRPIDFAEIDRQITTLRLFNRNNRLIRCCCIALPLIISGLPAQVCEQLNASLNHSDLWLLPVSAAASKGNQRAVGERKQDVKLVPGACLAVPLVSGDITMSVYGTVTEVRGDKVYGFGHSFLGYGPVDLPMATGKVHTVVSSMLRSFKLASIVETVGALTIDEGAAIFGQIGAKARTFPLTIRVERYNDSQKRVYNCRVANNRVFTP